MLITSLYKYPKFTIQFIIQNRRKRIKHMKLFINARFQRKLRRLAENPLQGPGSQVSGPTFRIGRFEHVV